MAIPQNGKRSINNKVRLASNLTLLLWGYAASITKLLPAVAVDLNHLMAVFLNLCQAPSLFSKFMLEKLG